MEGGRVDLVFVPGDFPGLAREPIDGCWRFAAAEGDELGTPTPLGTIVPTELVPGERYVQIHGVYQDGSAAACFPDESYRATERLEITGPDDSRLTVDLSYVMSAPADGGLSIEVEGQTRSDRGD